MTTLTDANSALTLSVPSVFAVPVPIEGYATDDAFDTENVAPNQAIMGIDGNLSAGHTPYPVKLKIILQADSPSNLYFDQWRQAEDGAFETYFGNVTIIAPGPGKIWTLSKGVLTGVVPTPPAKKIFQPQTYEITFQNVSAAPIP